MLKLCLRQWNQEIIKCEEREREREGGTDDGQSFGVNRQNDILTKKKKYITTVFFHTVDAI